MVYVVGCEAIGELVDDGYYDPYPGNNGVVWSFRIGDESNVNRVVLGGVAGTSSAVDIAVADGKFYACGFDSHGYGRRALYWTGEEKHELTDGSTDALAYCIALDGEDVYVGGYVQDASNNRAELR